MRQNPSTQFNKEKLVFLATVALLALSVYHLTISAPVMLTPAEPVTSLAPPGPLVVTEAGRVRDLAECLAGDRKNPFQPIEHEIIVRSGPGPRPTPPRWPDKGNLPPQGPDENDGGTVTKSKPVTPKKIPRVDFSGVITVNNSTLGLVKVEGKTYQVREGDLVRENLTVSRIEKQEITVSNEQNRKRVARDLTFVGTRNLVPLVEEEPPAWRSDRKGADVRSVDVEKLDWHCIPGRIEMRCIPGLDSRSGATPNSDRDCIPEVCK